MFNTDFFPPALRNSIGIALITTILALCFASAAAYAITRLDFPGKTAIYILSAFFREIPWELEKAAQMDGATPMQAFRRVIAAARDARGSFTAGILAFIAAWNDFLFAIVAHLDERGTDRARRRSAYFTGRLAVPAAVGDDRRGGGDRDRADRDACSC